MAYGKIRGLVAASSYGHGHEGYLLTNLLTTTTDDALLYPEDTTSTNRNQTDNTTCTVEASEDFDDNISSSSSSTSSTGGESIESTRDPDLRRSSSGPPPLSLPSSPVSISTSTSSVLFHEGLTRLDSFVDLTRLHTEYSHLPAPAPAPVPYSTPSDDCTHCDDRNALFSGSWQTIENDEDEYPQYLHTGTSSRLTVPNIVAAANDNNSTFYDEPSPTIFYHNRDSGSPSYTTSFFDPSPSSAGASPRTPYDPSHRRESFDLMAARPLVTPEPTEHATYWNSAVGLQQQQPYQLTMKNTQWRPQSAPKPTHSRSASPLAFWNKRGGTSGGHQLRDGMGESDDIWPRVGTARSRDDGDHMLVDTVSNHLGRLTPPSPSNSTGTSSSMDSKSKDRDLRISTKETPRINCEKNFNQGPPPLITKAEYEALPLAIQRKVR